MSADEETLGVYATRADDYAKLIQRDRSEPILDSFIAGLRPGARVLDLGCGPGGAAATMRDAGLAVDAMDASAEMVALARETYDLDVRCASFDALDEQGVYDGIWASFSLLHAPKAEMPDHLARIHRALVPGGKFGLGLKSGTGEARDRLGRFYAYYTQGELEDLLPTAGFTITTTRTGESVGLEGSLSRWIWIDADA